MEDIKREKIDVLDHAGEILKSLKKGAVLTSKAGEKTNSMTIAWGSLGIEWAVPVFTAYVREHRYTRELLDAGDSFTVSIPLKGADRHALGILGTKSGRDTDKMAETDLTYIPATTVDAPVIKEYALTLECKIVHTQLQDRNTLDPEKMDFYPQDIDGSFHDRNRDFHVAYIGEVMDAYIIS